MTKEELSEKRSQAIKSLNDVKAILGLDEMYIDELEKENAELKEKLNFSTQYYQGEKAKEQLIKAKAIINTFLGFAEAFGYSPSMDKFITDTKQFLSKVEK